MNKYQSLKLLLFEDLNLEQPQNIVMRRKENLEVI